MASSEDDKVRIRIAEIMSSGGLGYNQISLEVLYLLPREFVDRYIQVWEKALGSAGMGDKAGQQMARDAELGKAQTATRDKGKKVGAGAGGQGKKWKRMGMEIRDMRALDLKTRMDKRLRSMAREMRATLEGLEDDVKSGDGGSGGQTVGSGGMRCGKCGRLYAGDYRYCPFDSTLLTFPELGEE